MLPVVSHFIRHFLCPPCAGFFISWERVRQVNPAEASSYAGSVVAVLSSLTLTDIGIIVGIVTALATFGLNA